ncbi:DUF1758 domain-containing protein [Trichonephila clavipes]|nr:DUF1758 domain-containing protein [Trichonephila clavipes]
MLSVPKIQNENPVQLRLLIDMVRSHLRSLKNLRMDSNVLSDAILLHLLNSKIDRESQRLFQLNPKTEVPSLQDFFSFLETRCIQLESIRKTDYGTKNIPENVNLGDSRSVASKRLNQLWRRLDRDPKLNNLYTKFIEEYLSLDHMEGIKNIDDIASEEGFFLPHHSVLRAGNRSFGGLSVFKMRIFEAADYPPVRMIRWCQEGGIVDASAQFLGALVAST